MRRNVHRRLSVVAGCLAVAAVLGVIVPPETTRADHNPKHKPGGGGGEVGQEIRVCITFDDASTDGVRSDGAGAYCDGGKIEAIIGRNFGAVCNGNSSNKTNAGRTLFLDLSAGLGCEGPEGSIGVDINRPSASDSFGDGECDTCVDTLPMLPGERFGTPDGTSGLPDNAKFEILGRDLDDLLEDVEVPPAPFETNARLSFSVGPDNWILHWGPYKSPGGATFCPESDPILVWRSSGAVEDDTWTFETCGSHLACLYFLPKNSDPVYHGQFVLPFRATAVAMDGEFVGVPDGTTRRMVDDELVPACSATP